MLVGPDGTKTRGIFNNDELEREIELGSLASRDAYSRSSAS